MGRGDEMLRITWRTVADVTLVAFLVAAIAFFVYEVAYSIWLAPLDKMVAVEQEHNPEGLLLVFQQPGNYSVLFKQANIPGCSSNGIVPNDFTASIGFFDTDRAAGYVGDGLQKCMEVTIKKGSETRSYDWNENVVTPVGNTQK